MVGWLNEGEGEGVRGEKGGDVKQMNTKRDFRYGGNGEGAKGYNRGNKRVGGRGLGRKGRRPMKTTPSHLYKSRESMI